MMVQIFFLTFNTSWSYTVQQILTLLIVHNTTKKLLSFTRIVRATLTLFFKYCKGLPEEEWTSLQKCLTLLEELALYTCHGTAAAGPKTSASNSSVSRPMQRKLVTLLNSQLAEGEGRMRAVRTCRSIGERVANELVLLHQNPHHLSACLWAAVRTRGCQFLGPGEV